MSQIYITLDTAQAALVRGGTAPGAALEPMLLSDGETWILPVAVLSDDAHAMCQGVLSELRCRTVVPEEWPAVDPSPQ